MNCQNCKHWVEGYCMVTGSLVDKDVLCNAWELSLSWKQVAETQPDPDNTAELQERIDKLESDLSNKETEYTDLWDDALELQARIAELEAFIDRLIEVGNDLADAQPMWVCEEDSWDKLVKTWKEREK